MDQPINDDEQIQEFVRFVTPGYENGEDENQEKETIPAPPPSINVSKDILHQTPPNTPRTDRSSLTQTYSPPSQFSARTVHEGDYYDYMEFLIEPIDKVQLIPEPSTISSSYMSCVEPELQRTIAIIKPEAMQYKDVVLRGINENGFQIVGYRLLHLTAEQVSEIYSKYYGSPSFPHLVVSVSAGPVLALSLAALNAVSKWQEIIGPDGSLRADWFFPISVRSRFGLQKVQPNVLHASENFKEANRENRIFYPDSILEPLIQTLEKVTDYCSVYVNPTLLNGLTELVKKKPIDPILYLADWLLVNNPYQPRLPYHIAVTPT